MTDVGEAAATGATSRGWKKGLPQWGLTTAEESASKLWGVARRGMAAKDAFAKQLGMKKASGGGWDRRIALLRGFDLVRIEGDEVGLSPIGLDLVQDFDEDRKLVARRKTFFQLKAYRELVDDFDGTELPALDLIASKLEHEYGKSADFAEQAAQAFVESLRVARLLDANDYVRKDGPTPSIVTPSSSESTIAADSDDGSADDEQREQELEEAFNAEDEEDPEDEVQDMERSTFASVTLAVTLDLSTFRHTEVIEILDALGLTRRG